MNLNLLLFLENEKCSKGLCENGGKCYDIITSFKCKCKAGFEGDKCEIETDECQKNRCHNDAECEDLRNGYKCHCKQGFKGLLCKEKSKSLNQISKSSNFIMIVVTDVNPCEPNPCGQGINCIIEGDSFKCNCPPNKKGAKCEQNIKKPQWAISCDEKPCENEGTCRDIGGIYYYCECKNGYKGWKCEIQG